MSSGAVQRQRLVRILAEDPDLARRLDPAEAGLAERQTVGFLEHVPAGPWDPASSPLGQSLYGGVILSGLCVRELTAGSGTTAELLGAGEVILPPDLHEAVGLVAPAVAWTVLDTMRIAWLDAPFGHAVRRWPELGAALVERSQRRADRLALSQAVSQLTRVDDRVLILLWHLGERWGRVRPDGIVVALKLTHRVLARLVGARRPSVTTAVNALERQGRLSRLDNGGWLLHGDPPDIAPAAPPAPWRHGRAGTPAIALVHDPNGTSPYFDRAEDARRTARALQAESRALLERCRDDAAV